MGCPAEQEMVPQENYLQCTIKLFFDKLVLISLHIITP